MNIINFSLVIVVHTILRSTGMIYLVISGKSFRVGNKVEGTTGVQKEMGGERDKYIDKQIDVEPS